MAKVILSNISNFASGAVTSINANNDAIELAFENTLSRDGTTPNQMAADLDMNGNQILNLPQPVEATEPLRLGDLGNIVEGEMLTPPTSTDNALVRFDGVTGKSIQNSTVTLTDVGLMTLPSTGGLVFTPGSAVKDTNGNNLLSFFSGANAVNYLNIQNKATGGNPLLVATGADTNIGLGLVSKGTGNVFFQYNGGLNTSLVIDVNNSAFRPSVNDTFALGTSLLGYSDLFLASGGVINFASGDVTLTHSSNTLSFAGATSYAFDSDIDLPAGAFVSWDNNAVYLDSPTASNTIYVRSGNLGVDGVCVPATTNTNSLGTTALQWSDLFLGSGAVINFQNGDVTVTHSSDALTVAGGDFIAGNTTAATSTTTGALRSSGGLGVAGAGHFGGHLHIAVGNRLTWGADEVYLEHTLGSNTLYVRAGNFAVEGIVVPTTNNSQALGATSLQWADIYLGTGAVINYANGDYTLTHSAGLLTTSGPLSSTEYRVTGTKVVGARDTGWTAMTGTANEATAYATGTITLIQLAERVKALQDALTTHGLIGT